jgi:hypothetical protein
MPARVRIEGTLAHQPVHAGLGAQAAVGVVAEDLQRHALDAGDLAVGALEHLHPEAALVAVLDVHALEHRRPVLRLGAAGAGLDVREAVVGVERVGEHAPELERGDVVLDAVHLARDSREDGVVALGARHLEQLGRVAQVRVDRGQAADRRVEGLLLAPELLGARRVAPDLGIGEQGFDYAETLLLALEVKGTSAARPTASAGPRARRRSG